MAEDDDDAIDIDPSSFEDPVASRAIAFVHVGKFVADCPDEKVKEIGMTMLRKINSSIKAPSDAEVKAFPGGKS